MKSLRHAISTAAAAAAFTVCTGASHAVVFAGVDFPQGASSFADALTSFAPAIANGQPTAPYLTGTNALGTPNYAGSTTCTVGSCPYVSLGDGGSFTLEFVDKRLTGSASIALDLWIFEIGPDVEDTAVAVSEDGVPFTSVGEVFGDPDPGTRNLGDADARAARDRSEARSQRAAAPARLRSARVDKGALRDRGRGTAPTSSFVFEGWFEPSMGGTQG